MAGRGRFDVRAPIFRPLWRRILVVVAVLGWALVEVLHGAPEWGAIFGAAGLWCAWQFFVAWDDPEDDTGKDGE